MNVMNKKMYKFIVYVCITFLLNINSNLYLKSITVYNVMINRKSYEINFDVNCV